METSNNGMLCVAVVLGAIAIAVQEIRRERYQYFTINIRGDYFANPNLRFSKKSRQWEIATSLLPIEEQHDDSVWQKIPDKLGNELLRKIEAKELVSRVLYDGKSLFAV